ncbi:hypothetical protein SAMN05444372_102262 [Flavobacterium micromati]|uniref:Outer membrane protein beta-barrel domain-containing protein n=1 Tax=Flavobacterium micromati TaxID=229205 RepID=A0A1M5H2M3_9FLAO|nr:hypothetical protein [Flavobacterium micromati]SHG10210.1 hypothetical protein SAMN05444372_102262 [Flavobacterium micromati]
MKIGGRIKIAFTLTVALFFASQTQAQEVTNYDQGFRLGFGINGGVPTDENVYNYALGADVRLQYDLTKRYSAVLSTGFTNLFISNNRPDLGFIPIKAGFKAFVWDDQFYVLGEVGGGIAVTNNVKQDTYIWAPGFGYAGKDIDISLRYEAYTDYDTEQIALRIAYGFKL